MTSKERVYAAIEFKHPDRVPVFADNPEHESDIFLFEWNEIVPWKDWEDTSKPKTDFQNKLLYTHLCNRADFSNPLFVFRQNSAILEDVTFRIRESI